MTIFTAHNWNRERDIFDLRALTVCVILQKCKAILNLHNDHVLNSSTSFSCGISYTQCKVPLVKLPGTLIYLAHIYSRL